MENKKIKLVTHNSRFHADDVFATATLLIMLGDEQGVEILRTRDPKEIEDADFVYDTGHIYDPEKNRFGHHQEGMAGQRENGIPYSSFGLIWKKFGEQVCGSKKIAEYLDKKVVQPIDALDNGVEIHKTIAGIQPYKIVDIVETFNATWLEIEENIRYNHFIKMVEVAKLILEREIEKAQAVEKAEGILEEVYNNTEDKRIIVLDKRMPWENILNKYPEPLFVVSPREKGRWSIKAIRDDLYSFENRKDFPKDWAGKFDDELAEITGIEDAKFCHNNLFVAAAGSREGAIAMAKLAVNSK